MIFFTNILFFRCRSIDYKKTRPYRRGVRAGRNNLLKKYVLVTEYPELQDGLHGHSDESEDDSEDTYPPPEDDPAGIDNDDGGRLSSGCECDDDDADCDGAAALPYGDSNVVALTR